jgi:hypothetical protein
MCPREGKEIVGRRKDAEFTDGAGFEQEWPLVPVSSGERFCRPGGAI